ncbi:MULTISPECIES: symmetrical bis(5'-nucleosyl)-tetraphosphatase [unclassified Vibrio]|uniref:Bis(5'-nucleosyl)-tetraphosphatase, symmetrical n=1 Tax=Vibrio sp. HB236076 TaxID=3232307 RepID=A0AB39HCB9_9VIBR|nr:symmetrical bis(5'-nucleosyl)-tetraphosphatase [Vibrio sp. HB161653]MDP5254409.1 symmetrical bis(5'-nucleosyl)-tetraphosphatase [Vibrio sp. HB161653]
MANYIIGDIQGCYAEFRALLAQVNFDPQQDTLWLAGDLVARGPQSLETLRYVYSIKDSVRTVLGNHDLHLLATALGLFKAKKKDKTAPILDAYDRDGLLNWLRQQPLLQEHPEFVMTHAGISPAWDLDTARRCAREVEQVLCSDDWPWLIEHMYQDQPDQWQASLTGIERYRYIINAFTRMRFVTTNGALDMACKLPPEQLTDQALMPWFDYPQRIPLSKPVLFGHWAALEGHHGQQEIGLDTGCVWGNCLTLLHWETKTLYQQPAIEG